MFKTIAICVLALLVAVTAKPSVFAPIAYTAPVVATAPFVAPYASSYNSHSIAHTAAFPVAPAFGRFVAAAPVAAPTFARYVASPAAVYARNLY